MHDLSKLFEKGYYIVENTDVYVVFVEADSMTTFASDVKSNYSEELIGKTVFTLASKTDLGIE